MRFNSCSLIACAERFRRFRAIGPRPSAVCTTRNISSCCAARSSGMQTPRTSCSSRSTPKHKRRGPQLFYERDGREVRIERIYNRVIFDELERRPDLRVPFRFQDELDVTWVTHPNWYYRISKHSLPFLRT